MKHIKEGTHLIVLDVVGKLASSEELAEKMNSLGLRRKNDITFAIGGAFGLSPDLIKAADERFSQDDIYASNDKALTSGTSVSGV